MVQVPGFYEDIHIPPPGTPFEFEDYVAMCYSAHPKFNIEVELVAALGLEPVDH